MAHAQLAPPGSPGRAMAICWLPSGRVTEARFAPAEAPAFVTEPPEVSSPSSPSMDPAVMPAVSAGSGTFSALPMRRATASG
ncbi:hypothetical protein ACFPRL_27620 [Pseudoclavibacter helvolus]